MRLTVVTPDEAAAFIAKIGFEDVDHSDQSSSSTSSGPISCWSGGAAMTGSRLPGLSTRCGTDYFRQQSVDPSEREHISAMAGADAERLAYLFGVMQRDSFYRNFTAMDGRPSVDDRFTGRRSRSRRKS